MNVCYELRKICNPIYAHSAALQTESFFDKNLDSIDVFFPSMSFSIIETGVTTRAVNTGPLVLDCRERFVRHKFDDQHSHKPMHIPPHVSGPKGQNLETYKGCIVKRSLHHKKAHLKPVSK